MVKMTTSQMQKSFSVANEMTNASISQSDSSRLCCAMNTISSTGVEIVTGAGSNNVIVKNSGETTIERYSFWSPKDDSSKNFIFFNCTSSTGEEFVYSVNLNTMIRKFKPGKTPSTFIDLASMESLELAKLGYKSYDDLKEAKKIA